MRVFKLFLAACAACWSMSTASQASIIVSVDMDLATAGIQNTATALQGTSYTAGLFMQLTADGAPANSLGAYVFSVQFAAGRLVMTGRTESSFGSLNPSDNNNGINNTTGIATRFDGADFGAGQTAALGPVQVGTMTFSLGSAGTAAITPGRFEPNFDGFLNAASADVSSLVTFNGGNLTITAVPEPTSVALMGVGLVGLAVAGRRRWKLKAAKKQVANV